MSLTFEELRHSVLMETSVGWGDRDGVYQSSVRTTTSVTLPQLINTSRTGLETAQLTALLPDVTLASDRERRLGKMTVASGLIPIVGQAWSGSSATAEQVELFRKITPTQLFNQLSSVLKVIDQTVQMPLGSFEDSDCDAATAAAWTAYLSATLDKESTDAALIPYGRRSLSVVTTTAGGGARSPQITTQPGDRLYVSTVALPLSTATARLALYDVTNATTFAYIDYTGRRAGHLPLEATVPAGCYEIEVRALATGASQTVYFNHFCGPYLLDHDLNLYVPSWANEVYRIRKLRTATYRGGISGGVEDARSRTFNDWRLIDQASFNLIPGDAHPGTLQLNEAPPAADLWIEGKRSAWDMLSATPANTRDDETITTDISDREVILQCSLAVCDYILSNIDPTDSVTMKNGGRIAELLKAYKTVEPVELPPQQQEVFRGGLGARI